MVNFPPYLADRTTCRQNSKTDKNISSWELSKKVALAFPGKMFFTVIAPGINNQHGSTTLGFHLGVRLKTIMTVLKKHH